MMQSILFFVALGTVTANIPNNTNIQIPPVALPKKSLNLLLGNDDGWAEANIRACYQVLKEQGHVPAISAPTEDMSATGDKRKDVENLKDEGQYHSIPAGAPGYGCDPNDDHICYVNGYPVDAIDHGFSNSSFFGGKKPDLVLSGPNVGANIGPQAMFSGTFNAARWAAGHGIPAIATSVYGDKDRHGYSELTPSDPSFIYAKVVVRLVDVLTSGDKKSPYLPLDFLLNLNIQKAGPKENCQKPEDYKFVLTSQYGHSNLKFWKENQDIERCGTSVLPSEHEIMDRDEGCWASVTVRLAQDDARANEKEQAMVVDLLGGLLSCP